MAKYIDYFSNNCGTSNPGGLTTTLYMLCGPCELVNGMPATRADGVVAPAVPALGDSKIYDEPFDLTGAPSGEGFWRRVKCIIDEQELKVFIEGSKGNVGVGNGIMFKVAGGITPETSDLADRIVDNNGCGMFIIKARNGLYPVVGDIDNPAFVEPSEATSGKALGDGPGFVFSLRADSGRSVMFYDADTHGIDLTPNP